ncbi:MAG: TonB family protein [candidate division WOR-3 bacterium]
MYTERRFRTFEITLLISALLHLGGLLLLSRSRPVTDLGLDIQEISFMDVTYRPEVAKVLTQTPTPSLGGGGSTVSEGAHPTYATGIAAEDVAPLDMNAKLERSASQAKIELDRYELAREGEMDLIKIGGKGSAKTTEEILAEKPIPLARGPVGGGAGDLRGVPGVPQTQLQPELTIEHRPLTKPQTAPTLPQASPQAQPTIQTPATKGTSFQVAGPISQREIITKVKPRYPKWALEQRVSGTVTVRIWVMPNGKVKGTPQVLSSSGYPDLDQVVIEAVRSWEFAPLGAGVKQEDQWGDITFIFQLSL